MTTAYERTEEAVINFARGVITQGFMTTLELSLEERGCSVPSRQEGNPRQRNGVNQAPFHRGLIKVQARLRQQQAL